MEEGIIVSNAADWSNKMKTEWTIQFINMVPAIDLDRQGFNVVMVTNA